MKHSISKIKKQLQHRKSKIRGRESRSEDLLLISRENEQGGEEDSPDERNEGHVYTKKKDNRDCNSAVRFVNLETDTGEILGEEKGTAS